VLCKTQRKKAKLDGNWMAFTSALPSSSKIFDPDLEDRVQDQVTAKDLTSDSSVSRGAIDIIPDRPKCLAMNSGL
jgi:hypothetical protein